MKRLVRKNQNPAKGALAKPVYIGGKDNWIDGVTVTPQGNRETPESSEQMYKIGGKIGIVK